MPFFSIIIPLYNKEKYISNTLKSVLNQSFDDYEIIIVNDGSTDKSIQIIKNFNDDRIKIFHQENKGVSAARNKGMQVAKSKYFCFLDADDIWLPNHLQSFYDAIIKFPESKMICNRYVTKINNKKHLKNSFIDIANDYEGYISDFFKSSLINRIALTSAVCIDKDVYENISGFDTQLTNGEDTDFWTKIALNYKVSITKNTTLIYNQISDNISLSKVDIINKKISNFKHFHEFEIKNPSLKRFLDAHRIFYALHYYVVGCKKESLEYLKDVDKKNINFKTKILFQLPPIILRYLLKTKSKLKQYGYFFNLYR